MREINKGSFYFYFLKNEIKRDHIQMVFLHYWKTPTVTLLLNAKSLQINQREYQKKNSQFSTDFRTLTGMSMSEMMMQPYIEIRLQI